MDLQIQDPLMVKILELSKDGASKSKIVNNLAISHVRLRKSLGRVDKRFLQYIEVEEKYYTTNRGLLFLKSIQQK
jgi:predicted transcriptional regulator